MRKFSKYNLLFILILLLLGFFYFSSQSYASQGEPQIYYVEETNTIFIERTQTQIETIVDLRDIAEAINNENILQEESSKIWLLKANLWIKKGVKLLLTDEIVTWLKLESNPLGFVWLKNYHGIILIQNTKITSWDSNLGTPDSNYTDGRSFVLTKYQGRMDIFNSELSYLGFNGGEAYGVSWRDPKTKAVTGDVQNSTVARAHPGVRHVFVTN